jgi:hypothetical protein
LCATTLIHIQYRDYRGKIEKANGEKGIIEREITERGIKQGGIIDGGMGKKRGIYYRKRD